jgi:hypothetical protein
VWGWGPACVGLFAGVFVVNCFASFALRTELLYLVAFER